MKRPQYVFRPNLNEPQHRRAWALLQQVPPAKRKEFLVQSILAAEQTDRLEKSIRKVVREELQAVNIRKTPGNSRNITLKITMRALSVNRCSERYKLRSPAETASRQPTNASAAGVAITASMPCPSDCSAVTAAALTSE